MGQQFRRDINPKEALLENILITMSGFYFSRTEAEKIVGSGQKLMRLIDDGKIEVITGSARNSKWKCNAAQVLQHCRLQKERLKQ